MTYFFLSCSGEDIKNKNYVKEFFDDLEDVVRRRTSAPAGDIGFFYKGMREGTEWRAEVSEALNGCRVFVPLLSPRYFQARFCGQEWGVFADRQRVHAKAFRTRPQLIVPVIWEPVITGDHPGMPPVVAEVWTANGRAGARYLEHGMRFLVQGKLREREYHEVIEHLAGQIIDAAAACVLPRAEGLVDFNAVPDVFSTEAVDCPAPPRQDGPDGSGPRHVHLVVAAPTRAELAGSGLAEPAPAAERYDRRPEDWMPYRPDDARPVVRSAIDVAAEQELTPHPVGDLSGLPKLLEEAEIERELVVLLVDPWATLIPAYSAALSPYDNRLYTHSGVLLPCNRADDGQRARLDKGVSVVFQKNKRLPHPTFRDELYSVEAFKQALREVLVKTQGIFFDNHEPVRGEPVAPAVARPQLEGPGGRP